MTAETITTDTRYTWALPGDGTQLDDGRPMNVAEAVEYIRNWSSVGRIVTAIAPDTIQVRTPGVSGVGTIWSGVPVTTNTGPHAAINDLEAQLCGAIPDAQRGQLSDVLRAVADGTDPLPALTRLLGVPAQRTGD